MKTPRQYAEEAVASMVRTCGVLCREELTGVIEGAIAEALAEREPMCCPDAIEVDQSGLPWQLGAVEYGVALKCSTCGHLAYKASDADAHTCEAKR